MEQYHEDRSFIDAFKGFFSKKRGVKDEAIPNEWKGFIVNDSFSKEHIEDVVKLRDMLIKSVTVIACQKGISCKLPGSVSPLSDKDMIWQPTKQDVDMNEAMKNIKDLIATAASNTVLENQPPERILELFDINIYTTSFEIYICIGGNLTSIIRKGQPFYVSSKHNCSQRNLAFCPLLPFIEDTKIDLGEIRKHVQDCQGVMTSLARMCKKNAKGQQDCSDLQACYNSIIGRLTNQYQGVKQCEEQGEVPYEQGTLDNLVNMISYMSTLQREAYVTQGSYLRWVLLENQTGQVNDEIETAVKVLCTNAGHVCKDNIIEQLCLAYKETSALSRIKYLSRAYNATLELYRERAMSLWMLFKENEQDDIYKFLTVKSHLHQQNLSADVIAKRLIEYPEKLRIQKNDPRILNVIKNIVSDTQFDYVDKCLEPTHIAICSAGGGRKGTMVRNKQVKLLGRTRNVYKYGRQSYVRVKGSLILIREAKELEKKQKAIKNKQNKQGLKDKKTRVQKDGLSHV